MSYNPKHGLREVSFSVIWLIQEKNSVTFNDNDAFLYSIDQLCVTKSRWMGKSYGDKLELGSTTYGIFYLPDVR